MLKACLHRLFDRIDDVFGSIGHLGTKCKTLLPRHTLVSFGSVGQIGGPSLEIVDQLVLTIRHWIILDRSVHPGLNLRITGNSELSFV
jgi:hypothetical protein